MDEKRPLTTTALHPRAVGVASLGKGVFTDEMKAPEKPSSQLAWVSPKSNDRSLRETKDPRGRSPQDGG